MCFKQAGLMQDLRARLINGGFSQVAFRILNTESTANETDGLWRLRYAAGHPTIPVLQEMPTNLLWHNVLDGAVDHILVLDRCSRLTYQVITPWSILHFPYVKAAILSTYEDDPCGPCALSLADAASLEQNNINSSKIDDFSNINNSTLDVTENVSISTNNSTASISEEAIDTPSSVEFPYYTSTTATPDIQENVIIDDAPLVSPDQMKATLAPLTERTDGTVPIRVVMHAPHLHRYINGTVTQHEYLELQTGNPDYHGHLQNGNNIVVSNTNDELAQKRKKYKGQRRKGKLRPETIQAETQQDNYEDTKLKHHRDKERPEKKKQKTKSDEQNASEEAATAASLQDAQPTLGEVNTEVPQEIQQHYDYRNMPYFSSKHLHKPLRVTEATTAVTESSSNVGEQQIDVTRVISKVMTSDKQIIKGTEKIKDHRKWKSQPPQKDIPAVNATSNSDQHNTDLNFIDNEEHKKFTSNKAGKEMDATIENQPTNVLSNEDDDESKKEIIQHYSQLLKWIQYTLPETRD